MSQPLVSLALTRSDEGEAVLLQEDDFDCAEVLGESNFKANRYPQNVYDLVYNSLKTVSERITNLRTYGISVDDVDAFYSNIINDNPDLFYVSSSFIYYYNEASNLVTTIVPKYVDEIEDIPAAQMLFDEGVNKALSCVDNSMNDLQKAVTLHDYICSYAVYPTIYDENGAYVAAWDKNIYHSAYGFFYDYNAVCAGYTLTYSYLLKELGIESEYAVSSPMEHAWNKIKIDGEWYNVDITYDNFDFVEAENTYGVVSHRCFLKSDSYFKGEGGLYHYGYELYDGCDSDSTLYDDAFWNDVNTSIYTVDGDFYYLDPVYDNHTATLVKRTADGTETTIPNSTFRGATLSFSNKPTDENGVIHKVTKNDILIRFQYMDNKFYVSAYSSNGGTQTSIVSLTKDGERHTVLSGLGYLISLGSIDGELVYQTYADMSTVVTLDKREYFRNNLTTYNSYPDANNDGVVNGRDWGYIINS